MRRFAMKSRTDMASNITPKNFLEIFIPFFPIKCSTRLIFFKTIYTSRILKTMATIIFSMRNFDLNDKAVVSVPGPATRGNTIGMIVACPDDPSLWKISQLKVISIERVKSINAPAIAKEAISVLNNLSKASPANKKAIIIESENSEAFSGDTLLSLAVNPTMIGIEPVMSITANKTMKEVITS